MPNRFDTIVLGTGGVGAATLLALARRGHRAVGIDPFGWGHDRGSSHGQTRIIRQAYFEHPDYVPLLLRAYQLWHELQAEWGRQQLFFPVGLLQVGPADGEVLEGVRRSAAEHRLPLEWLASDEIGRRFPQLPDPGQLVGALERQAGYLLVEQCVRAQLQLAIHLGARWHQGWVRQWQAHSHGVTVRTDQDTLTAGSLVVCAGAWADTLVGELALPLQVLRKHLYWFPTQDARLDAHAGCPTFLYELPGGCFYGFPRIDELGVKLAEHTGGTMVERPAAGDNERDEEDERRVTDFAGRFPRLGHWVHRHSRCYYTVTPDRHFIVDRHPELAQVVVIAGLSGHGFKLTPVLGEVAADLAIDGRTDYPVAFLRLDRFGGAE